MTHTDINTESWISKLPERWQPYAVLMRLDRPIGWWLLVLPAWWGIILGANGVQGMMRSDFFLMITFLVGAIVMRGAGCVINDLWDRELDKQVERTKDRPLASGAISLVEGIIFLFFLLFLGFIILLQTSFTTIGLGFLAMIFVATYPLMKRITWWPQAFLGITFNFGALMGWAAATHDLRFEALMLYAAAFFWTLGYDTIYAHQDKKDDELVGIKSTALLFGERSPSWVRTFYTATFVLLMGTAVIAEAGFVTYVLLLIPFFHFMGQVKNWDPNDPENSLLIFKSNRNAGLLVLLAFTSHSVLSAFGLQIPDIMPMISELLSAI
jgi:4-hydroxybenzoate polyprenyltransferase